MAAAVAVGAAGAARAGRGDAARGRHGFDVKSYDLAEARATADFAPVYRASEAVPSWRLRELVRAALGAHGGDVLDPLPASLDVPLRRDAVAAVHFPADLDEAEQA